jgi:RimJ/RimL family protein N-acetyltransferase
VTLEAWGSADLPLLERLMGDPRMTEHLGGPESPDKLRERQVRYERLEGGDRMFKIVDVASGTGIGSIGFWTEEWRGEQVYEVGWMVVPEFQGRGVAAAATVQAIEFAKREASTASCTPSRALTMRLRTPFVASWALSSSRRASSSFRRGTS